MLAGAQSLHKNPAFLVLDSLAYWPVVLRNSQQYFEKLETRNKTFQLEVVEEVHGSPRGEQQKPNFTVFSVFSAMFKLQKQLASGSRITTGLFGFVGVVLYVLAN